jgi:hypothetical protein
LFKGVSNYFQKKDVIDKRHVFGGGQLIKLIIRGLRPRNY